MRPKYGYKNGDVGGRRRSKKRRHMLKWFKQTDPEKFHQVRLLMEYLRRNPGAILINEKYELILCPSNLVL